MKKLIFGLFFGILAIHSCQKSSSTATEAAIDTTEIPDAVLEYIANNFPDAAITSATTFEDSETALIVGLDNHQEVAFDRNGDPLDTSGVDYRGGKGGKGKHGKGKGKHHGDGGKGHGDEISVDSLPQAILDYLAANYAGYTPKHAETDTLCSVGAVYEVALFKDSTDRVKLFFDPSGTFLMSGKRVGFTADVPQAVKDLLTASYAAYTPRNRAVKLTMADGSIQYVVYLKNGSDRKKVFVKEDGTLVCEQ